MNKNIIIAILIVIVVAAVGAFVLSQQQAATQDGKINTQINFLGETTLQNGDQVQFELKDAQGAAIAGEPVVISYDDGSGNIQTYNIHTDANGSGFLTINGEDAGNYDVTVDYNGSDIYNGCTAKETITVEAASSSSSDDTSSQDSAVSDVPTNSSASTALYNNNGNSTSNSSSSSGNLHHDSKYNFDYDDNGIIRGGQSDGMSADYLRDRYESGDMVDSEGNLQ